MMALRDSAVLMSVFTMIARLAMTKAGCKTRVVETRFVGQDMSKQKARNLVGL